MKWKLYNTTETVEDIPDNTFGFIYVLHFDTGEYYIGKKQFYNKKTLPELKNGKQRPNSIRIGKNKNGKRVYFDVITVESNWREYVSSSKILGNRKIVDKEILEFAETKKMLTYLEEKWLFEAEVLTDTNALNDNIGGRYFSTKPKSNKIV